MNPHVEREDEVRQRFLSGLVLDRSLSPRRTESFHVRELTEALRAGADLPPIVVEQATSRVVDGFHRVEACREVYGREALIGCIENFYANQLILLVEADLLDTEDQNLMSKLGRLRTLLAAFEHPAPVG